MKKITFGFLAIIVPWPSRQIHHDPSWLCAS